MLAFSWRSDAREVLLNATPRCGYPRRGVLYESAPRERISSAASPQISSTRSVDFVLARQGKDFVFLIKLGFTFSHRLGIR